MLVKSDKNEILNYLTDASNFHGEAEKVIIPEYTSEVPDILRECFNNGTPVHISGMGTGLTGGRVPQGGVVISTERLNKIINIDPENMVAEVEGGVILAELQSRIKDAGLYYPPDPTEQNSSIGGNIANNASGAKTFRYGPTRDYISGLKIVLADGETLTIKRGEVYEKDGRIVLQSDSGKKYNIPVKPVKMPSTKNASGYYLKSGMDVIDLFIGSEGTLGVVLSANLKLLKRPENFLSVVIFFDDEKIALDFVSNIRKESKNGLNKLIDALGIEFFDNNALNFLREDYPKIPPGECYAIWLEQEVNEQTYEAVLEKYMELMEDFRVNTELVWFANSEKERREFIEFRHAVSWKVSDFISRNNIRKVGTDLAVPDNKFQEFYRYCKDTASRSGVNFIVYGHFGNSHIHLNLLPENEILHKKAKEVYFDLCKRAADLGGTISAEHGIGKIKREYLKLMYSAGELNVMREVKKVLDPKNILSPGNIFE